MEKKVISKIITLQNVSVAFAALDKPFVGDRQDETPFYSLRVSFDKNDEVNKGICDAGTQAILDMIGDENIIRKMDIPIYIENETDPSSYFFNTKNYNRPQIVDHKKLPFTPASWEDFPKGTIVNMVVNLRFYNVKGRVGISKYVNAVQRVSLPTTASEGIDYIHYFNVIGGTEQPIESNVYEMDI